MHRREFLQRTAATVGSVLAGQPPRAQGNSTNPVRIRVTVDPTETVAVIPSDFIGLGYEISSVARPGLLSPSNQTYVQLVRTLGSQGVIRIGGNTSDYSTYVPSGASRSSPETGPGSVINNAVLHDLGAFLETTGWALIWGLNLGRGTKQQAIDEAEAVLAATGSHLLAFEIGNEPDLFSHHEVHRKLGYDYGAYLAEYRSFRDALRQALPSARFAGPDVAVATDWVTKFAKDERADLRLLTHHYYREGQSASSTIEKLLAPDSKLDPMLAALRAASSSCGVPYRICETNSFSGGGRPGVSDRFASALWVLDFMYELASAQCAGINVETGVNQLGFVSSYSPIGEDGSGHYRATPEFYGLLAFTHGGAGNLIAVRFDKPDINFRAYATRHDRNQISVTLINKESESDSIVTIAGTEGRHSKIELRLSAHSLDAASGIEFGGSPVGRDGSWHPASDKIQAENGNAIIHLPAASAAVLTFEPSFSLRVDG